MCRVYVYSLYACATCVLHTPTGFVYLFCKLTGCIVALRPSLLTELSGFRAPYQLKLSNIYEFYIFLIYYFNFTYIYVCHHGLTNNTETPCITMYLHEYMTLQWITDMKVCSNSSVIVQLVVWFIDSPSLKRDFLCDVKKFYENLYRGVYYAWSISIWRNPA